MIYLFVPAVLNLWLWEAIFMLMWHILLFISCIHCHHTDKLHFPYQEFVRNVGFFCAFNHGEMFSALCACSCLKLMRSCLGASCMSETSWLRLTEDLGLTLRTYCVERFPPPTEWINYTCPPWGVSHFGGLHRRLFRPRIFLQYIRTEDSLQLEQRTQESSQQHSANICLPRKPSSIFFCDSAALNTGLIFDDVLIILTWKKKLFIPQKL